MILRDYQSEAVQAVYEHLRTRDDNPCVVIPTGGGKTPVLAQICRDAVERWDGRVVVLAHVKELLEQAVDKLRTMAPQLPIGVYSAGLGRRDLAYAVTVAGIQSIYAKAKKIGSVDLIIVDECHLLPEDGEGRYRRFLSEMKAINPLVRIIGLTATPYRMKSGSICGPDNILNHVCYEVGVRELIARGFLSPLRSKAGVVKADTSQLHTLAGEYVAREVENLMDADALVESACAEIIEQTADRKSVLIFASGVHHAKHIVGVMERSHNIRCGLIYGDTSPVDRARTLLRFRQGELKYLANVNVLTTGFDAPNIDCIALLRPTLSPGLYYQMVGRGFRVCEGKADCLILDFGGNVLRHGPVDAVLRSDPTSGKGKGDAPAKECPNCNALIHAGYAKCPECRYAFPEQNTTQHEAAASNRGVITGQTSKETVEVSRTEYYVHHKKDNPAAPTTMRVEYEVGLGDYVREWVCFDHTGFARRRAEAWWRMRTDEPVPGTVEEAVRLAKGGALPGVLAVTIEHKAGSKWESIVGVELAEKSQLGEDDNESMVDAISTPEGFEVPF